MKLLTRGSTLALVQTERVASSLRFLGLDVDLDPVSTKADRDTISPLCSFGGSGAFSSCIEEALLRGMGDGAVHSLKDLPSCCREGLEIAAVCPRDSVEDLLLCREEQNLENLPRGAVVGTSSPRRRAQLLRLRPDLSVRELRGNVATRLQKLHDGLYDAIVLAHAGLDRLGIRTQNTMPLPFLPAPCQGIIALEAPLNGALFPLGERITEKGIGNGISVLIFAGIVSRYPSYVGQALIGQMGIMEWIILLAVIAAIIIALNMKLLWDLAVR